ncbi:RNA pseudouridine synthase [Coraliomargarita sp. SDUM461004]|uniref:RNA pseudouridine synthase n=1 Tax=Thalassobacterium sedimentorum TaxID=3041258 RepID=A0ABU1AMG7_9BACT|nr:RNA pseudouridine synthase [Coraliomargarita sp. SDUM461004]MDQ8195990.1 RNA pseudouridine synthase [Coraliomargarita sp. SDUM461004]
MSDFVDTSLDQLPLKEGVSILAHNQDGLIALDKPAGVMSHPNCGEDQQRALLVAEYDLEQECYFWQDGAGGICRAWLINRLDSPTSGVILLGLNPEISATIKKEFSTHRVTKIYYALVRGKPGVASGSWLDQLNKHVHSAKRSSKMGQLKVSAKTRYQVIKSPTGGFPVSLMKLMPLTGRTHQLRVQCKKHGLPIVGDRTYGSFSFNKEVAMKVETKRMLLHSAETIVHYNYQGRVRELVAKSALPEDFTSVMNYRPGLKHTQAKGARNSVLSSRRFKAS